MRRLTRGLISLLVTLVLLVAAGGVAMAYWPDSNSGNTTVATGSLQPVTIVTSTVDPRALLYPGADGDLVLRVRNPNSSTLILVGYTADTSGPNPITVVGGSGCTAATSAVAVVPHTGLSIALPPGQSDVLLPGGVHMDITSPSGCQAVTFGFALALDVRQ